MQFLSQHATQLLAQAVVTGAPMRVVEPLQVDQNAAARLAHVTPTSDGAPLAT